MEFVDPRELSLADLETELVNVQKCKQETEEFLNEYDSIDAESKARMETLKTDLELLKKFSNKDSKIEFSATLTERESNLNKAIEHMKSTGAETHDPRSVPWE